MTYQPPATLEDVPTVAQLVQQANETVAGLDDAKRRIALLLRRHMVAAVTGAKSNVPNMLVIGQSGGGKTYLLNTLVSMCPVPWAEVNMPEFSDVGYQGRDMVSMYAPLFGRQWAGDRKEDEQTWTHREMVGHAQRFGVILLDEFDKLRTNDRPGERQVGKALQAELLKLVEGASIEVPTGSGRTTTFSTHNVLHIAMGAFEGLDDVMLKIDGIMDPTPADRLSVHLDVDAYDVHKYGFTPELVGRFSNMIAFPNLDHAAMDRVLRERFIPEYRRQMAAENIDFVVDEGAIAWLAGEATKSKSGARGLTPLLEAVTELAWSQGFPGCTVELTADSLHAGRSATLRVPVGVS